MIIKRLLIAFTLVLIISSHVFAQVRTITGRILDAKTQAPVKYAAVIAVGNPIGTLTNFLGYFQLELAPENNKLVLSHVSYETSELTIPESDHFSVMLDPTSILLEELNLDLFLTDTSGVTSIKGSERTAVTGITEKNDHMPMGGSFFTQNLRL